MNSLTVIKLSVLVAFVNAAACVARAGGDLGPMPNDGNRLVDRARDGLREMHLERAINPFNRGAGVDNLMVVGPANKARKAFARRTRSGLIEGVGETLNATKDGCTIAIIGGAAGVVGPTAAAVAAPVATGLSMVGGGIEGYRAIREGDAWKAAEKLAVLTLEAVALGHDVTTPGSWARWLLQNGIDIKNPHRAKLFMTTGLFLRNLRNRCRDDGTEHTPYEDNGEEPVKRAAADMLADFLA